MTHDELLVKIDTLEARYTDYPSYLALRAVVELHKPLNSLWYKQIICESCQEGNDYPITYPCPTIRVILKELA